MNDEEILADALNAEFRDEARGYVAQINRNLLELETGAPGERRAAILDELRRTAHTLKGSAGFTTFRDIVDRAHEIETLLDVVASSNDRAAFNQIYEYLDQILSSLEARMLVTGVREPHEPESDAQRTTAAIPEADAGALDLVSAEESIRVPTRKLNALMGLIGEILVARVRGEERRTEIAELRGLHAELASEWADFQRVEKDAMRQRKKLSSLRERRVKLDTLVRDLQHAGASVYRDFERDSMQMTILTEGLQEEIKRVRMQPIGSLFETYRRTVRDLAVRHSKDIRLTISGESAEVDKKILEELREPLLHLIRNSIDHGFETSSERAAAGKPAHGTLTLRATATGQRILVEVSDDGRGFDFDSIHAKAVERGLVEESRATGMSEDELGQFVFASGLSTRSTIGELSGRGVGLDAVREKVIRLQGDIAVHSARGRGTTFSLSLPLTLSTSRGLLVRAGDGTYALPFSAIQRIIRVRPEEIVSIDGFPAVMVEGKPIGVVTLANVLGKKRSRRDEASHGDKVTLVVVVHAERHLAVRVDALVGEQEMVVKALGPQLAGARYVAGAALLGSGAVVIVLQPADLFGAGMTVEARMAAIGDERGDDTGPLAILVVEDSLTTRTLEKSILETAGYRVVTARDGVEALSSLEQDEFDLVISDVNMPRMDGLELVREMRQHDRTADVPLILVTSLGSEQDRRAGLDAGANAYVVKTEFDQSAFLGTIRGVIG
ncbi:MAG: hybrid sensor histidine kinase/response regulator [Thermoanaerobaculia bacterium]|jgi:two-component system chemotaxis sensor kinase CheA